ncbi:MAG: transcription antitermination factor NusB [Acidobacteria bacterium]|nr:transcription antitermination factor NusB [Acidobacteriota bacterium]NIM63129.1 transcription antitermination factor NusB [Acidobacteriota bacterium]NIO58396.1 transcription antitermination factor NusB [Acidobacteriota bacterium]NIQ29443.1 transcription antitermination factor NusB [Acidobacteriota bacterium]NIQ84095.1 transcription antitermination factor NusB [Acidobacteriota bacterium]
MLFQIDISGDEPQDVYAHFWESHDMETDVRRFSQELVDGVYAARDRLDARIAKAADRWRLDRMAVVDRNILRMALYELDRRGETPPAVVIDEAIEVARRFGTDDSARFVNGVLDALRSDALK